MRLAEKRQKFYEGVELPWDRNALAFTPIILPILMKIKGKLGKALENSSVRDFAFKNRAERFTKMPPLDLGK